MSNIVLVAMWILACGCILGAFGAVCLVVGCIGDLIEGKPPRDLGWYTFVLVVDVAAAGSLLFRLLG